MAKALTVREMRELIKDQPDDKMFAVIDNFGNAVPLTIYDAHVDDPIGRKREIVDYPDQPSRVRVAQIHAEVLIICAHKVPEMD